MGRLTKEDAAESQKPANYTDSSDTDSATSEEEAESSSSEDKETAKIGLAPTKVCWLVIHTTHIAHMGVLSSAAEGGLELEDQAWKPRCGTSTANRRHTFAATSRFPAGFALCNRRGFK